MMCRNARRLRRFERRVGKKSMFDTPKGRSGTTEPTRAKSELSYCNKLPEDFRLIGNLDGCRASFQPLGCLTVLVIRKFFGR